jgi:hypothetical protein
MEEEIRRLRCLAGISSNTDVRRALKNKAMHDAGYESCEGCEKWVPEERITFDEDGLYFCEECWAQLVQEAIAKAKEEKP